MSFSSDVKDELCAALPEGCCRVAMAYGMAQAGRAFSATAVSLQTEHNGVADVYERLLREVCGVHSLHRTGREGGFILLTVEDAAEREAVLARFGHAKGEVALRLNRANFECDGCPAAYLAGAFLACGAITNPETGYHLEFHLPHYNLSRDLLALLRELSLSPKYMNRKGNQVIYFKESEQIEDCLTRMGATGAALELMGVKMVKNIRNNANRVTNCESANIDKTVAAATVQREAIRRIQAAGAMELLPPELRELALLRWDNPELSLRELGAALSEPISRSGVNHRLRRIQEFADALPADRTRRD